MRYTSCRTSFRQGGFGLVEIMIGLLIGIISMLVMLQMLSISSKQNGVTNSGNDATNEGAIALYSLKSEISMAGYGLSDLSILGCSLQLRTGVSVNIAPVTINPTNITGLGFSRDAATDSLIVMYSGTNGAPLGDVVSGANNAMQTINAFAVGDWVIAVPITRATPCNLTLDKVTALATVNGSTNPNAITLNSGSTLTAGMRVFNLGNSFRVAGFALYNANLTTCDYTNTATDCTQAANWISMAPNIASLRVQYGRETVAAASMNAQVNLYDQTSPDLTGATNAACSWARIPGLRLALVARSAQPSSGATQTAPVWDGQFAGNPTATSTATAIDLSANTSWQNYRYKVFQTTLPLRNITWVVSDPTWAGKSSC